MIASPLLVTGCYRSGTTVLEKILHMHPKVILASQPFPVLYFFVKGLFLKARGIERRYPLEHLLGEDAYRPEDLHAFLDQTTLTARDLSEFFDQMEAYSEGLWTPEMTGFRDRIRPGLFIDIYRQLLESLAELFPKDNPQYLGSKEILIEELAPYLLTRGVKVITVLRDPRAMISSLNFRDRDNLTGDHRPILYSLRVWRKSVATAFTCESQAGFHWLRYEDLALQPTETLAALTQFLDLPPYAANAFDEGIHDQYGKRWKGNSSFRDRRGISADSVRAFERKLPPEIVRYIETVCYPEMRALGYDFLRADGFDPQVLSTFREPFETIHGKFSRDHSTSPQRIAREQERFAMLEAATDLEPEEARRWFLSEAAFQRLRAAIRT